MAYIGILLISLMADGSLFSQDKMIVDQTDKASYTYYGEVAKSVDLYGDLPSIIRFNVEGYLQRILGTWKDSVVFFRGQVVDLGKKFKSDSAAFKYEWYVPRYDLVFKLRNRDIGIQNYNLRIKLDDYGQIIYANLPKKPHLDKNQFKDRKEIEKFALKEAENRGLETKSYEVNLKYNVRFDKLFWVFAFPLEIEQNERSYNYFEIPCDSFQIINEYRTSTYTSY